MRSREVKLWDSRKLSSSVSSVSLGTSNGWVLASVCHRCSLATERLSHGTRCFWCRLRVRGIVTVQSVTVCDLMYGGLLHTLKVPFDWTGMQTSQATTFLFYDMFLFGVEPHTESLCVCARAPRPSVHNQCEGSGNSSRHIDTSPFSSSLVIPAPDLLQLLCLFFQTQLLRTGGERERGWVCREERSEREEREGGWEWGRPCQLMHFGVVIRRELWACTTHWALD